MAFDRVIPNQDGAGVIDLVGHGVDPSWLGERVWVHMAQWRRPSGTAAEWAVVPVDRVARLPDSYSYALGACLGIPWLTAHLAVSKLGAIAGRDVLVTGGSGAVAIYAIQIAAAGRARVITTVGSERAAALVSEAGASVALDFRQDDLASRIRRASGGRGIDRVIESRLSANTTLYAGVLAQQARIVVYGTAHKTADLDVSAAIRLQSRLQFIYAYAMPRGARRRATEDLAAAEASQGLVHLPITTFPLESIADAHEAVERGLNGHRAVIDMTATTHGGGAS